MGVVLGRGWNTEKGKVVENQVGVIGKSHITKGLEGYGRDLEGFKLERDRSGC